MHDKIFNIELDNYLKEISETPTLSGFEHYGQEVFTRYAGKYLQELHTDKLHNVIGRIPNPGKPRLMLTAHVDQVGLLIKYIDDNGMLYTVPVGGIDVMLLAGQRVCVHHGKNAYLGIFARKPIHLLNEQERRGYAFEDLWLDLGFTSRTHAEQSIAIGDMVTFETDMRTMSDDRVTMSAADNKVGGAILLGVLQQLQQQPQLLKYDLYIVSSVQEEIGLRGSMPATSSITPDYAIVIDATHATDYPTINNKIHGEIALGEGPILCISPDTNYEMMETLRTIARTKGISYQVEAHPNASGTESRAVQLIRDGVTTATISFAVRYMHSPSEIFSRSDMQDCIRLIVAFCQG